MYNSLRSYNIQIKIDIELNLSKIKHFLICIILRFGREAENVSMKITIKGPWRSADAKCRGNNRLS